MKDSHSFNTHLASRIGIEKAILIKNLAYWVEYNKCQDRNFFEDKYWTYNSSASFAKLYPYMKPSSIRRWFKELEEKGWIISGNFNCNGFDQTKWYTMGITYYRWVVEYAEHVKNEALNNLNPEHDNNNDPSEPVEKQNPIDHFVNNTDQNEQPIDQNEQCADQNEQSYKYIPLEKPNKNNILRGEIKISPPPVDHNFSFSEKQTVIISSENDSGFINTESEPELIQKEKKKSPPYCAAPPKEKKKSIHDDLRELFMTYYFREKDLEYIWSSVDAVQLKKVTGKIEALLLASNQPSEPDKILNAFDYMLLNLKLKEPWVYDHLTVPILNSQFNVIVSKIRNPAKSQNGKVQQPNYDNLKMKIARTMANHMR